MLLAMSASTPNSSASTRPTSRRSLAAATRSLVRCLVQKARPWLTLGSFLRLPWRLWLQQGGVPRGHQRAFLDPGGQIRHEANVMQHGVVKVNVDTDLQWAYLTGIRDYVTKNIDYLKTQVGNPEGPNKPNVSLS